MAELIFTSALGILLCVLGAINMTGNVRSLHRYHWHRVTPENIKPFGKLVGLGTIIIGIAISLFSILMMIFERTQIELLVITGSIFLAVCVVVGLILIFYAMIKYNKGIF
jgi:Ca2+/Na+ antiporter